MNEKRKIMIGTPFIHEMPARFHLSVTNLAHQLNVAGHSVDINYREGSLLSSQRNNIAKAAMKDGYDLLFIDSDMVFSVGDAMRLIDSGKDIIGGLYYARRSPYMPLVFREDLTEERYLFRSFADSDIPAEPFLCKGMGAGFLFLSNKVLKVLWADDSERPFNFLQLPNGDQYGEDLSFFHRCNTYGLEIWCDPLVDIGHLSTNIIYRHDHQMHVQMDYHYCNDIPGWMSVREQNWLYEQAKKMDTIIEIGSWKGKSTHALCCGCRGQVTAIDHFIGTEDDANRSTIYRGAFKEIDEGVDVYKEFLKNTAMFTPQKLQVIQLGSQDAIKYMPEGFKSDMIFIDGGHEYDEVMADLKAYEPHAGKLICGHDYPNFPGVQKAVNEYFDPIKPRTHETIWYVEK